MLSESPIGLERKKVRLVPYDPRWPSLYELEANLIRDSLGNELVDIAHIGSTAVSGLQAKPVIDIMLGLGSLRVPLALYEGLVKLGYVHKPDDPLPDRLFFSKDASAFRTHNLSACAFGSNFWVNHLRFRDLLRARPALAASYVELKRRLAALHPDDRLAYTDGKDKFIALALAST